MIFATGNKIENPFQKFQIQSPVTIHILSYIATFSYIHVLIGNIEINRNTFYNCSNQGYKFVSYNMMCSRNFHRSY